MAEATEKNDDQSMEEILQSIRRIIAEEDDQKASPVGSDVLELTEVVEEEPARSEPVPMPEMKGGDILSSIDEAIAAPEPMYEPAPAAPAPVPLVIEDVKEKPTMQAPQETKPTSGLISSETAASSGASLKHLIQHASRDTHGEGNSPAFRSGATIEELTVEAIKPMLKEWLDANLPALVEKVVEKEIRRLSALNS